MRIEEVRASSRLYGSTVVGDRILGLGFYCWRECRRHTALQRGLDLGSRGAPIDLAATKAGNDVDSPELERILCMAVVVHVASNVPSCGVGDHVVNVLDRSLRDGWN